MPELALVTNVKHYLHQVYAAQTMGLEVGLCGPWYPSRKLHSALAAVGGPVGQLARRRGTRPEELDHSGGLGVGQFIPPLLGKLGLTYSPSIVRTVHSLERYASRRAAERADFVHAVEGLAPRSGLGVRAPLLLERRNLHHEVFEAPIQGLANMPAPVQILDSLRDVLVREYRRADVIQVYSQTAKDSFLNHGYPAEKLAIVPIPFQPMRKSGLTCARSNKVLYIGRCVVEKGIDVAVEATRLSSCADRLIVAGPATAEVASWLSSFAHVTYLGVRPREDISKLMMESAILVMPSIESFGLAVLESIDHSLPVLVRESTGVSEFLRLQDPDSVLVGRDPEEWAARIDALLSESEDDRSNRINRQRAVFQYVSWQSGVDSQILAYKKLGVDVRKSSLGTGEGS